jgi:PAS domain S-box-containing protein
MDKRKGLHPGSIGVYLTVALVLVTTGILFGFGYHNSHERSAAASKELRSHAQQIALRLSLNLAMPVWNLDTGQLREALLSEMSTKEVQSLVVRDADGVNILAAINRDAAWAPVEIATEPADADGVFVATPIKRQGMTLGSVEVHITKKFVQEELRQMLWASAISVLFVDGALVAILLLVITVLVIRPLAVMQEYARRVGDGDLTRPVMHGLFLGELGELKAYLEAMVRNLAANIDAVREKSAEIAVSEERYRSVIQNIQDVYYRTDAQGRMSMISPSVLSLCGFGSMDEVLGQPVEIFYMFPAERHMLLRRLMAEGVVRDYEVTLRRKDGSPIQVATTSNFYRDAVGNILGVEGIFRDITERKMAEERLRQSEEKFSRIFQMAPESITFIRLHDSVVIDANAAFESITGHARREALGRSTTELGFWDLTAAWKEFLAKLEADGHVMDYEFQLRRKDGALRRGVIAAQLVTIAGEQCYVSIIHDITDERRMQDVLIQTEKMMSVGSLAAGIAHEINNPLGIVHQAVQNILQRTRPGQKKNQEAAASIGLDMNLLQQYLKIRKLDVFLDDIQVAAQRASGIIRNMLNFSRRSESSRAICDLAHIVEQSVFLASSDYDLKKSYDFKRIQIFQDVEKDLPWCYCTETEIEQVLLNLLRNAAQAMSTAQPPTPNPRIDIRLRSREGCVRIEVADNGPGMLPDVQRKAFEPFFTTKPPGVGTGLGLSVSYFIISKGHGGRMWLTSALNKGTTFFIELPLKQQEGASA